MCLLTIRGGKLERGGSRGSEKVLGKEKERAKSSKPVTSSTLKSSWSFPIRKGTRNEKGAPRKEVSVESNGGKEDHPQREADD